MWLYTSQNSVNLLKILFLDSLCNLAFLDGEKPSHEAIKIHLYIFSNFLVILFFGHLAATILKFVTAANKYLTKLKSTMNIHVWQFLNNQSATTSSFVSNFWIMWTKLRWYMIASIKLLNNPLNCCLEILITYQNGAYQTAFSISSLLLTFWSLLSLTLLSLWIITHFLSIVNLFQFLIWYVCIGTQQIWYHRNQTYQLFIQHGCCKRLWCNNQSDGKHYIE